jgi:hypothetical protein
MFSAANLVEPTIIQSGTSPTTSTNQHCSVIYFGALFRASSNKKPY